MGVREVKKGNLPSLPAVGLGWLYRTGDASDQSRIVSGLIDSRDQISSLGLGLCQLPLQAARCLL
jgi:hypothetical protein